MLCAIPELTIITHPVCDYGKLFVYKITGINGVLILTKWKICGKITCFESTT